MGNFPHSSMCFISFFVLSSRTCTIRLRSRAWKVRSYPGRFISFFVLSSRTCTIRLRSRAWKVRSYPGHVRSVSNLARGLPRSAPLHARGRDFYIFCALFGDPVINRYLRDINVLQSLCFWSYSMLFYNGFLCFMPRVSVYMTFCILG